jgi:hypothetical protein
LSIEDDDRLLPKMKEEDCVAPVKRCSMLSLVVLAEEIPPQPPALRVMIMSGLFWMMMMAYFKKMHLERRKRVVGRKDNMYNFFSI